jgi:hypothetical protein
VPKVFAQDGLLTVELRLSERIKAGRKSLSVELWRVKFILVDEGERRNKLGTQQEGRSSHTGAFMRRGERSFVYWPKHTPAITIQVLDPSWSEIIIGDENAKELASALRLELAKAKSEPLAN